MEWIGNVDACSAEFVRKWGAGVVDLLSAPTVAGEKQQRDCGEALEGAWEEYYQYNCY